MLEESPILFHSLSEVVDVSDYDDTDDLVQATENLALSDSQPVFGASLRTHKADAKQKAKGQRFSHRLVNVDTAKEHDLFKKIQEGDELWYINKQDVTSWSHDAVMKTIHDLEEEITFTFHRKSVEYIENDLIKETDELFIEVTFVISDLGSDVKGGIDDIAAHIKKIAVKFLVSVTYSQRLSKPQFKGTKEVSIRHGAMLHDFLSVQKNKPVMKKIPTGSDAESFTMYSFAVFDEKLEKDRDVVAIQCKKTKLFLMCSMGSKKLSLMKDDDIDADMTNMAANSPCLFFVITNKKVGDESVFFESLAYPDYYLAFDVVDLLRVEKLAISPNSPNFVPTDCIRRNFTFVIL